MIIFGFHLYVLLQLFSLFWLLSGVLSLVFSIRLGKLVDITLRSVVESTDSVQRSLLREQHRRYEERYDRCIQFNILSFVLSLVLYTLSVYVHNGVVPFDLLAFTVSVVATVVFNAVVIYARSKRNGRYDRSVRSPFSESFINGIAYVLWVATFFFLFYFLPWLGCAIAVAVMAGLLWVWWKWL